MRITKEENYGADADGNNSYLFSNTITKRIDIWDED